MKLFYGIILLFLGMSGWLQAQAPMCEDSYLSPFCNGIAQYPANFDSSGAAGGPQAPPGPNYDCLGSEGNPNYFSLTVEQSGSISFTLDNTNNVDIDFILWGPFTDINHALSACDSMGHGGQWGEVADCGYDITTQEPVFIPNAMRGEIYILMVTNHANTATNIFSTPNNGTGSLTCACDIPYTIDTLTASTGNQGYLTDTINGINQFVVCPNNTLVFKLSANGNISDSLSLFAPLTTISRVFTNSNILPNYPSTNRFDSIDLYSVITPTIDEIGVNNFSLGLHNKIFVAGVSDSSCYDLFNAQVIVPGVRLRDRNVCPGEQFQVMTDSIPTTTLGSSSYNWRQLSGIPVSFSSTTDQNPVITIPPATSSSSNDSIVLIVEYAYGGLCSTTDTMVLRFSDLSITAKALPDSICPGATAALDVIFSDSLALPICNDYEITTIPFAPLSTTGGTAVTTFDSTSTYDSPNDEGASTALPIGFNFDFYCNTYSQFYIHTNGFITFDSIPLGDGNFNYKGAPIPLIEKPNNLIAMGWEDLNLSNGGNINYYMTGIAPNRKLVVNLNGVASNLSASNLTTAQAILSEKDNSIELHITSINHALSTIGLENGNGSLAHFPTAYPQGEATGPLTNIAYRFAPRQNGPYYTWTPAASLNNSTTRNPIASPNVTTNYTVVTTNGTCVYTDTIKVTVTNNFPAPVVTCDSSNFNQISFSWSDIGLPATGFYEYSLDSGRTWTTVGSVFAATATNLAPDKTYTVRVRGNSGATGVCSTSPYGTNTCNTSPCLLVVKIDSTRNPTCIGSTDGYISVSATGGTPNYNFVWDNNMTTDSLTNLSNGTYKVTVTDIYGCTDTGQVILNVLNPIVVQIDTVINNSCDGQADGSINVTALGGIGTLSYIWSNNATTQDLSAVPNGIYSLTVTDGNGCSAVVQDTVVFTVVLGINDSIKTACAGDPILVSLTVTGGSNSYRYNWGSFSSSTRDTAQFTLVAGATLPVYVTVTDITNSCTVSDTINLQGVSPMTVSLDSIKNIPCDATIPGHININIVGGTAPYTYLWSNASTSQNLTSTTPGSFSVTVSDKNGCTATASSFTLNQALAANVTIDTINLVTGCNGQATGALIAHSSDTSTRFSWSNNSSDSSINNLSAGIYTVTATNSFGCIDTASVKIITPTLPILNASVQTVGTRQVSVPLNTSVTLIAGSTNFDYVWTSIADPVTGNATITNSTLPTTTANPNPAGNYWYIVTASATTNDTICSITDTVMVIVEKPFKGIPTAFTPNGDNINDFFRPTFLADEEVSSFRIYNRWGQIVYNGDDKHGKGWDGSYQGVPQPAEVYIYVVIYKKASETKAREVKGEVTLIR